MYECHRCEAENSAEHPCPDCGQYTCESCFEPMTQFNAGTPCVCLTCAGTHEEERHREAEQEHKREVEAEVEAERVRAAKASEARRVYNSPEAVAQRAAAKAVRDAMRAKMRAEEKAILVDLFSHFFG